MPAASGQAVAPIRWPTDGAADRARGSAGDGKPSSDVTPRLSTLRKRGMQRTGLRQWKHQPETAEIE